MDKRASAENIKAEVERLGSEVVKAQAKLDAMRLRHAPERAKREARLKALAKERELVFYGLCWSLLAMPVIILLLSLLAWLEPFVGAYFMSLSKGE